MLITLGHHLLLASQRESSQGAKDSKTLDPPTTDSGGPSVSQAVRCKVVKRSVTGASTGWRHELLEQSPASSLDKKSARVCSSHPAGAWVAWMGDASTESPPLFGILGAAFERWCDTKDKSQREPILKYARDALIAAFEPVLQSAPAKTERLPKGVQGLALCNARQAVDRFLRLDVDPHQRCAFLCAIHAQVARDAPGLDGIRAWAKLWTYLDFHPTSEAAAWDMTWVRANLNSASVRKRWVQTRVEAHLNPDLARIAADYESHGDANNSEGDFDGGVWLDRLDLDGAVVLAAPTAPTPESFVRAGAEFRWKGESVPAIVLDWTPDDAGNCPVRLHEEEATFKVLLDLPRESDGRGTVFRVPRDCLVPYSVG